MKKESTEIVFTVATEAPARADVARVIFTEKDHDEVTVRESGEKVIAFSVGKEPLGRISRPLLFRKAVGVAKSHRVKTLVFTLSDILSRSIAEIKSADMVADEIATNSLLAQFEFTAYKSAPRGGWNHVEGVVLVAPKEDHVEIKAGFAHGKLIGEKVNVARTLANTPGGEMTPTILAQKAKDLVAGTSAKVTVLGKREMEKLGMGGVLGVARGSSEEPKFIIVEYWGGNKKEAPLVLVGKGVTFDTGGLNLKPESGIYEMHMDMSGGAVVLAALSVAAELGLRKNVVVIVPAAENMPSGSSYRPGDLLRTMNGKTIEVLNTDAEGRIILADALEYAKKYKPALVVDVATLTGAAMSALGQRASALFTKDPDLEKMFRELGEESGDRVWPLPLWDEYEREIKGTFGDWANLGKTRYGGAITGAMFLYQFVKNEDGKPAYPWVHIDMAPRMTAVEGDYLSKGASGEPVRLLVKLIEKLV